MTDARTCTRCSAPLDEDSLFCSKCGAPTPATSPGRVVDGRYEILEKVGEGGMGEVFKVRHLQLGEIRLIKVVKGGAIDEESRARFLQEARLACRIRHPNVAALYDLARLPGGRDYMVWEFIEGESLHARLSRGGAIAAAEAIPLALEILAGLSAIHDAGVVHRDISPDNIMLARQRDGSESAKIIDLGIARPAGVGAPRMTSTGMFVGKLRYCSPEQAAGLPDGEDLDGRSDLYSFAVVLYEMLTGEPPYAATTPQQFLVAHVSESPRPLRTRPGTPPIPPSLEAVVLRGLAKERALRWSTASEFASALRSCQLGRFLPGQTAPTVVASVAAKKGIEPETRLLATTRSARQEGARPSRRRWIVASLVLAAAGGLGVWSLGRFRAPEPAPPLPQPPTPVAAAAPPAISAATASTTGSASVLAVSAASAAATPASSVAASSRPKASAPSTSASSAAPKVSWHEEFPLIADEADATAKYENMLSHLDSPSPENQRVPHFVDYCNRVVSRFPESALAARMRREIPPFLKEHGDNAWTEGIFPSALLYYEDYERLFFAPADPQVAERAAELRRKAKEGELGTAGRRGRPRPFRR